MNLSEGSRLSRCIFRWYQLAPVPTQASFRYKKDIKEKRVSNSLGNRLPLERFVRNKLHESCNNPLRRTRVKNRLLLVLQQGFILCTSFAWELQIKFLYFFLGHYINDIARTFLLFCRVTRVQIVRLFYISLLHDVCPNDAGWLVMVVKDEICDWGKNCGDKPCFLYSKKNAKAVWSHADGKNYTTLLSAYN